LRRRHKTHTVWSSRRFGEIKLERRPRLADHVQWVEAAGPVLGATLGSYSSATEGAQSRADAESLADDPVGAALLTYAERHPDESWSGDYAAFRTFLLDGADPPDGWPKNARHMSSRLDRLTPALRRIGMVAEVGSPSGHARKRTWTIRAAARPPASSAPAALLAKPALDAVDRELSRTMSPFWDPPTSASSPEGGVDAADDADGATDRFVDPPSPHGGRDASIEVGKSPPESGT
jgi:hypothetical protein